MDHCSIIAVAVIDNYNKLTLFNHIPVSSLYCFGVSAGDFQLEREDDGSSPPISLSIPFPFFGASESIVYVSQLHVIRLSSNIADCQVKESTQHPV